MTGIRIDADPAPDVDIDGSVNAVDAPSG